eukprot:scaffold83396_cov28-Tisochrysis_lutea.AAC.4
MPHTLNECGRRAEGGRIKVRKSEREERVVEQFEQRLIKRRARTKAAGTRPDGARASRAVAIARAPHAASARSPLPCA